MKNKPIAVIGGMGPEASAYFYTTLINDSVKYYGAKNNDDFPQIVLYSIPVPDFISNSEKQHEAVEILKKKVQELNSLNPLCGAIACNTAHIVLKDLQAVANFQFVSMVDEIVREISKSKIRKIAVLGTPSTLRSAIYQNALNKENIETLIPSEEDIDKIDKIIRNVISESTTNEDKNILEEITQKLIRNGAEAIVLGCTELPLIFPENYFVPVYNSTKVLSRALLDKYYATS